MNTFQAIVFGFVHGFTEFLPVSAQAHHILVPYLLGWPEPSDALLAALSGGALLSLLVYFRHDWAAFTSCFLQVVIFRKKPMTLDERMPIFIAAATAPIGIGWYYFQDRLGEITTAPLIVAGTMAAFGIPLWLSESLISRKNKNLYDWNVFDALVVGLSQLLMAAPGCGRVAALLPGAFFRNYSREAAIKFSMFTSLPILIATAVHYLRLVRFHGGPPGPEITWLSFWMAGVVALLCGLLSIGGVMRTVTRKGFGGFLAYRILVAGTVAAVYWLRSRE